MVLFAEKSERQLILLVPFILIFAMYIGLHAGWYVFWISEGVAFLYSLMAVRHELKKKELLS